MGGEKYTGQIGDVHGGKGSTRDRGAITPATTLTTTITLGGLCLRGPAVLIDQSLLFVLSDTNSAVISLIFKVFRVCSS